MTTTPHYATSIEHPSVMQAPAPMQPTQPMQPMQRVSTNQTVAPDWQGKFALFSAKPGAKCQYSGRLSIPAAELPRFIAYLQMMQPNQRGDVECWLTGFLNTPKAGGNQYIGGYVSPQTQGPAVAYAQQQQAMASPAVQQQYANPAPPVQPTQWQTTEQPVPPAQPPF